MPSKFKNKTTFNMFRRNSLKAAVNYLLLLVCLHQEKIKYILLRNTRLKRNSLRFYQRRRIQIVHHIRLLKPHNFKFLQRNNLMLLLLVLECALLRFLKSNQRTTLRFKIFLQEQRILVFLLFLLQLLQRRQPLRSWTAENMMIQSIKQTSRQRD